MEERRAFVMEKEVIAEAVESALNKRMLPCQTQASQIMSIEKDIIRLTVQLTGNGAPEKGMVYRVMVIDEAIKKITEKAIRDEGRWWALILTTIWEIVTK